MEKKYMFLRVIISFLILLCLSAVLEAQDFMTPQRGAWSAKSIRLWPENTLTDQKPNGVFFKSPSGRYALTITVKNSPEVKLTDLANQRVIGTFALMNLSLSEILWSPDEKTFALTQSDGGWVGAWIMSIGQISDQDSLSFLKNIDRVALSEFKKKVLPKACADEYPNMAAAAWVDTNKLLIVGEVPPHSSCKEMGALFGYVIEIPSGKILKRIDEKTLTKEWTAQIGSRLKKN